MIWQTNVERCKKLPRMTQIEFEHAFAATGFGRDDQALVFARTHVDRGPEASCDINYKAYMANCFPDVPPDYVCCRVVDDDWVTIALA